MALAQEALAEDLVAAAFTPTRLGPAVLAAFMAARVAFTARVLATATDLHAAAGSTAGGAADGDGTPRTMITATATPTTALTATTDTASLMRHNIGTTARARPAITLTSSNAAPIGSRFLPAEPVS